MKKLVLMMAALAIAACGDDDKKDKDNNNNNVSNTCTAAENTYTKCSTDLTQVLACNGSTWVKTKDCVSPDTCQASSTILAACKPPPGAEFDPCTGSGQGTCATGLTCMGQTSKICAYACNPSADPTGCATTNRFCYALTETTGACFETSAHLAECYDTDYGMGCEEEGDICLDMMGIGACTGGCDAASINAQDGCLTGEYCLPSGSYVLNFVPCQGTGLTCNTGSGYACTAFTQYADLKGSYCAKQNGTSWDFQDSATCDADLGTGCEAYPVGWSCLRLSDGTNTFDMCAVGWPVCADLVSFWDGSLTTDPNTGDPTIADEWICGIGANLCGAVGTVGTPAQAMCYPIFGQTEPYGVCIGFCEDATGSPTLSCGTGSACVLPTNENVMFYQKENAEEGGVTCVDESTCTTTGYGECVALGGTTKYCARQIHVCQPS